jgi:methionyl-tRNA formyltransferase
MSLKILFMGTTDFAAACLESVLMAGHEVACVCTQPDRPKNRGMKLMPPPVKEYALSRGIEVIQPAAVKSAETVEVLRSYKTDIFVVVAYGRILPKAVLDIPPLGCVNVHASLLPKYRGSAPIQWAVINGEKQTGVTTMYLAEGMDSGDMIEKASIEIDKYETFGSVYKRLTVLGAELIVKTLSNIEKGIVKAEPQNHAEATFAPPITREHCLIDWNNTSSVIVNQIRGLDPKPGASALINGSQYKLFSPELTDGKTDLPGGSVVSSGRYGLELACGNGETIIVKELHAQGGKRMSAADYLRGHKI